MLVKGPVWFPPLKAFDNLWYIGNDFVGAWVLNTGEGLILFDALQSEAEVRDHLEPGLRALGFEPGDTATSWSPMATGTTMAARNISRTLRRADRAQCGRLGHDGAFAARQHRPRALFRRRHADRLPPRRDMVMTDGQKLGLATASSRFSSRRATRLAPSRAISVRDGRQRYMLSLLGGTAFPRTLEGDGLMGGI